MWRIAALVLALSCANIFCAFGETIRVTTWNLEWFPSGSAKSLPAAVEQQRIAAAAEQIKFSIQMFYCCRKSEIGIHVNA